MAVGHTVQHSDLAVHGGPKTRADRMPARMAFGEEELRAIKELFQHYKLRQVDFGYQDTYERLYTDAFVRYLGGAGFADAVSSGTAALFVAIAALQLSAGSHVIVSPVTDPGTLSAVILNQLVPVIADSRPDSYLMGAEQVQDRITSRTRAVVVVHAGGKAAPVDEIVRLALARGIRVVEDCSQAHGASLNGRKAGTFGDISAFSTMYRKAHATGGCGGVVFTANKKLHDAARAHADRGKPFDRADFDEKDPTQFLFPALNLNIDEISCAIGLKSLEKLNDTIARRAAFLDDLNSAIRKNSIACKPADVSPEDSPFFHTICVDTDRLLCSKHEFAVALRGEGIDVNPHYLYVAREWPWVQPYLADSSGCRNAINYRNRSFNLLFHENYGPREIADIVDALVKVERAFLKS